MSLTIYTESSVKEREDFIWDIRPWFHLEGIPDTQYSRDVLRLIDRAKYFDTVSFIDEWGIRSNSMYISDTSKCMLMLPQVDGIVNGDECGWNCGSCLVLCRKGRIYLPGDRLRFLNYLEEDQMDIDFIIDGHHFTYYEDYYDYIEEVY